MTAHFHTNILQNTAPQELNKHTHTYGYIYSFYCSTYTVKDIP